jgi:diguanylate cyclase (GGDEF)-like protein
MSWFSLSIRSMVGGLVGLLGLILAVVVGSGLLTALDRYEAAERVAALAAVDKMLFFASQNYRLEKGRMGAALALSTEAGKPLLEGSLAERSRVDAAMAKIVPALARLELTGLPAVRERLGLAYEDVKLLRAETDSAVARPLDARDRALRDGLLLRSGKLLQSMEAVSVLLEADIRRLDPVAWDMVRAKTIAWEARAGGGDNASLLNEVLAGHRAMTTAELTAIRINDGRIKAAWGLVRLIAEQPDTPVEVREAFARAQATAFEGPSVARREALIGTLTVGPDPTFTVEDLSKEVVPPLAAVGAVAVATMEVTTRRADERASSAKLVVIRNAATLVVTIVLVVAGFVLITRRVTGPIRAMTEAMSRLAESDFSTVIPGAGRADEIGGMAGAVEVFKDGLIRNKALTEELERLATIDGMTGIYNRRHFLTLADREWTRFLRHGRPLSLLMMDIDFFKSINDRFGHHIGDHVIVHLATLARECKRDTDVLSRIGGEEFALLLPETDLEGAQAVAERVRLDMASAHLMAGRDPFSATVSIGVATAHRDDAGIVDLMKAADAALYEAKRGGRNQVVCFKEPAAEAETADLPVVELETIPLVRTA